MEALRQCKRPSNVPFLDSSGVSFGLEGYQSFQYTTVRKQQVVIDVNITTGNYTFVD